MQLQRPLTNTYMCMIESKVAIKSSKLVRFGYYSQPNTGFVTADWAYGSMVKWVIPPTRP